MKIIDMNEKELDQGFAMKKTTFFRWPYLGLVLAIVFALEVKADLTIAHIFSDHMVLQRDQKLPVWGWTSPAEQVTLSLAGQSGHVVADEEGSWMFQFEPIPAGGPYQLVVKNNVDKILIKDILIGDIWLCSGQSNMDWPLERSLEGEKEVAGARYDKIRLFKVLRSADPDPRTDLGEEKWMPCTPENAHGITAVGYFFARELQEDLGIPVGVLQSAWGGTRAEAWTEISFLEKEPELQPLVNQYLENKNMPVEQQQIMIDRYEAWRKASAYKDPGTRMDLLGWADFQFNDQDWPQMELPGLWEGQGLELDGSVWFRRKVTIPVSLAGKDLIFHAGLIDDFDITYFNGIKIGETNAETRKSSYEERKYRIPSNLVKVGEVNVLAIRVFDGYRRGGIGGDATAFYLKPADEEQGILLSLGGTWRYQIEHRLYPISDGGPAEPVLPGWRHSPSNLYNGMIAPLLSFAIKGVIWYQGESNAERPEQYKRLFPTMINSWRNAWKKHDLPFYWVQLANYKAPQTEPYEGGWAYIREAQTSALTLDYTGMAVITDVGDAGDIHPRDKQTVGHRLALIAKAKTYGRKINFSGPQFRFAEQKDNRLILHFDHSTGGLQTSNGNPLQGFGICDTTGKWYWAEAKIEDTHVILSHPEVKNPSGACYNWADNPIGNLVNDEGLPANSFRVDL